jgi:FAD-dependent oxidoreductase domain-containing protein 1
MMRQNYDLVIVGAGILGVSCAYHILSSNRNLHILLIDRLKGVGRGDTARSAAAYRDLFVSAVNRDLSRGSITFYEALQEKTGQPGLMRVGYLWLLTAAQTAAYESALDVIAASGGVFETLNQRDLARRLPGFQAGDIVKGVLGVHCGILNPNRLARFYEAEILALGGQCAYGTEVSGFVMDPLKGIRGVKVGPQEILAGTVIVATGAWMGTTMALAGLTVPVVPKKRQLFAIPAKTGPLSRLLRVKGFNAENLLPFTILPGMAYLRPAAQTFIAGYADEDRLPGLEARPAAETDFFAARLRPQLERYFPAFHGVEPSHAWAGHYDCHPPDNSPFVDRVGGAIVVGGSSGSGIMKGDSLGRVVAGLYGGRDQVELGDGRFFNVADISLAGRNLAPEELVI